MKKIDEKFVNETVRRSVLVAYNEDTRQLQFLAVSPVPRDVAVAIMKEACPSYNAFTPSLLAKLPADAMVQLAREGSVCAYVTGNLTHLQATVKADECSFVNTYPHRNVTRFWWD